MPSCKQPRELICIAVWAFAPSLSDVLNNPNWVFRGRCSKSGWNRTGSAVRFSTTRTLLPFPLPLLQKNDSSNRVFRLLLSHKYLSHVEGIWWTFLWYLVQFLVL